MLLFGLARSVAPQGWLAMKLPLSQHGYQCVVPGVFMYCGGLNQS